MNKHRILIVDDEPVNIKYLLGILKSDPNYEIFIANNGKKALEIASSKQLDLILLDIIMPDMNGYEVCSQLKKQHHTQSIPIIFITALDSEIDEGKGFEMGAVDYIAKPLHPIVVKARVKTHLQLKRQSDILTKLSFTDGLTGLFNRGYFNQHILAEWTRSKRNQTVMSLVMADIDFFKLFNDGYGHLAGDECLKEVARCLSHALTRESDACCRYGGEEFISLLPATDLEGALLVANKQLEAVRALSLPDISSKVTVSLGVASLIPQKYDNNYEILISMADSALYRAKRAGRNCIKSTTHKIK